MNKPFTHSLLTGTLSLILLLAFQAKAKAECHALFGYHQLPNTLTVAFIDSSSSSNDITTWLWNFGDGGISDNHAPSHTYNEPGTYEVCLTIHDNHDCTDTYCQLITVVPVEQNCNALFSYTQT